MRIRRIEVQIRRDRAALYRQGCLDQTDDARGCLQVAEIGLDRTGQQWRIRLPAPPVDRPEGTGFDGVPEQCASPVRLDIVDLCWLDTGIGACGAQHRSLGGGVRRHQSIGSTVLINR